MNHRKKDGTIQNRRLYPINLKRIAESEAKYPKALLEELYITQGLSQSEIAKKLGIQQNKVSGLMRKRGIKARPVGQHDPAKRKGYRDGTHSRKYRIFKRYLPQGCEGCGKTEKLVVHHKNNDHFDNAVENLAILCVGCHSTEHKKMWWACKKAGIPYKKSNGLSGWNR